LHTTANNKVFYNAKAEMLWRCFCQGSAVRGGKVLTAEAVSYFARGEAGGF